MVMKWPSLMCSGKFWTYIHITVIYIYIYIYIYICIYVYIYIRSKKEETLLVYGNVIRESSLPPRPLPFPSLPFPLCGTCEVA